MLLYRITGQFMNSEISFPVVLKAERSTFKALAFAKGLSVASAKSIIRKRGEREKNEIREEEKQEDTQKRAEFIFFWRTQHCNSIDP